MKKVFKELKQRQIAMEQQAQQMEQQKIEQQREIVAAEIESAQYQKQMEMENENINKQLDRISKEKIAIIQATGFGNVESEDTNNNQIPDAFEVSKFAGEQANALREHQLKQAEIASKQTEALQKLEIEKEKLKVERENMANDIAIAKINAKNRANKAKTKKK